MIYFSVCGHSIIPYPGLFLYTASKHSVTVLTEGLRKELSDLKSNIRITVRKLFFLDAHPLYICFRVSVRGRQRLTSLRKVVPRLVLLRPSTGIISVWNLTMSPWPWNTPLLLQLLSM
jgi:hypothetical protein